jgi:hypothetical protein
MKKQRSNLYVCAGGGNEYVVSGLRFSEFIEYAFPAPENIMLLKGGYLTNKINKHNFEVIEGSENVAAFSKRDIYDFGDFCFVDYARAGATDALTPSDVAALLYLAHMYQPLGSPFIPTIGNRFAYLAHDDEYFCRLFSIAPGSVSDIISRKIISEMNARAARTDIAEGNLASELAPLIKQGVYIDFSDISSAMSPVAVAFHITGFIPDMEDVVRGNVPRKNVNGQRGRLSYGSGVWSVRVSPPSTWHLNDGQ